MSAHETTHSRTWRVSPDLLGIVDQAGVFVETNPAWQTVLGWPEAEIRSMVFSDFLHPDDVDRTLAIFDSLKAGNPALHFENRYRCKQGGYRWLSWVAVPEGDIFVCSARDITRDKERARRLKSSEDEARLREQFVAILSHDLRNPLASIGSAVRIAAREPQSDKAAQMLASIGASATRMAQLIDVTMDFARASLGGGIPVDRKPVSDLKDRFERVIDEIRLAHPGRDITLDYRHEGAVTCDPDRLDQLLSNLVANAVTHGSRNRPIVVGAGAVDGDFELTVANEGKPIPEEIRAHLFEPFNRATRSESLQGLGLGLYIAAEIARAHDGEISAASDAARTVFRLRIPVTPEG